MMTFAFIDWTASPVFFTIFGREIRWYGLAFAAGFALGLWIVGKIWKNENLKPEWMDSLFIYVFVATVVGARLGHCLFYGAENDRWYYLEHPIEILKIWEGGLASHGGVLGILIAIWIYSKRVTHKSMLWTLDRLVVPVGFVAALIRFGNLMNHEIYGHVTNVPWAFRFIENLNSWQHGAAPIFTPPSHPTQIYEAICYILTSVICLWLYWKKDAYKQSGLIFGVFFLGIFVSRFFIEYFKNVQEPFEENMILNMGQLLSIPFILIGAWFTYKGLKERKQQKVSKEKK